MTSDFRNHRPESDARRDQENHPDGGMCGQNQAAGQPSCCDPSVETCCTPSGCSSDDPNCCGRAIT